MGMSREEQADTQTSEHITGDRKRTADREG